MVLIFLGYHYQIALKMGQNHKIMDNVTVKKHILQTDWQFQVSWLHFLKQNRKKYYFFAVQIVISTVTIISTGWKILQTSLL